MKDLTDAMKEAGIKTIDHRIVVDIMMIVAMVTMKEVDFKTTDQLIEVGTMKIEADIEKIDQTVVVDTTMNTVIIGMIEEITIVVEG